MAGTVYVETSVVSYLTARRSPNIVIAAHQQITRDWWNTRRRNFTLYTSQLVLQGAGSGDPEMAAERLKSPEFLTLSGDHIGALEIDHFVYLSFGDKVSELLKVIEVENPESAIVFCNTKDETKRVAATLSRLRVILPEREPLGPRSPSRVRLVICGVRAAF